MPYIDKVIDRPREYLAGTGVPHLAAGLGFFFLGAGVLIQQLLPSEFLAQEIPRWILRSAAQAPCYGAPGT
jgi:hypothetical protein